MSRPELLQPAPPANGTHAQSGGRPPGTAAVPRPGDLTGRTIVGGLATGGVTDGLDDTEATARANALALALQQGDQDALPTLIEQLRPLIRGALHRYRTRSLVLPAALDLDDLYQQSWLIIDGLARRWDPSGGDFPAYVRVALLWELWRYVRALSPSRRARAIRVDNVQHDILIDRLVDHTGADGRHWVDQLIVAEMLSGLDPVARWVLLLHHLDDRPFQDVAQTLRLTQATTYRAYRRAMDYLRLRNGLVIEPDDTHTVRPPGIRPAVERMVTVLHEWSDVHGRLPGRAVVCARADVSEIRYARLMGLLVTRGCIVGRSARKPGRLVNATVEGTLAQLRRRPPQDE